LTAKSSTANFAAGNLPTSAAGVADPPEPRCAQTGTTSSQPHGGFSMLSARRWFSGLLGGVLVLAALGSTASSAAAAKPDQRHSLYAPSMLVLTIAQGESPEPVQRATMLRCGTRGGDHPSSTAACRALDAADGNFAALAPKDTVCTLEYRPVTVTAHGVWRGKLVSHEATFGNACELRRTTGQIFDF
jgi:hypothetical protein